MSLPKAKFEKKLEEILKGKGIPEEKIPREISGAEGKIGRVKEIPRKYDFLDGYGLGGSFILGIWTQKTLPYPLNIIGSTILGCGAILSIYDALSNKDKIILDQDKIDQPYNPKNVAEQASEYIKE